MDLTWLVMTSVQTGSMVIRASDTRCTSDTNHLQAEEEEKENFDQELPSQTHTYNFPQTFCNQITNGATEKTNI